MNYARLPRYLCAGIALGAGALPSSTLACATCFGQSSDAMAQGMNMGIFALLIVIGSVLIGIASFFVFLARRSARVAVAATGPDSAAVPVTESSSSIAQTTP